MVKKSVVVNSVRLKRRKRILCVYLRRGNEVACSEEGIREKGQRRLPFSRLDGVDEVEVELRGALSSVLISLFAMTEAVLRLVSVDQ